ncbi:MAG: Uma2 family endonuclease [Bryobacteraceae bacterium]
MTAATIPLTPVDEYLNGGYHPDREYVDGLLVERNVGTPAHSLLQILLGVHFFQFRKQYRYAVLTEARTLIVPRSRYRIPDVMLLPLPVPRGKVVDKAPLVVIEVLSPEDTVREQLQRFREYLSIGVAHMLLLDPEELRAYSFRDGVLQEVHLTSLALPAGDVPFDTDEIFRQLSEEYGD